MMRLGGWSQKTQYVSRSDSQKGHKSLTSAAWSAGLGGSLSWLLWSLESLPMAAHPMDRRLVETSAWTPTRPGHSLVRVQSEVATCTLTSGWYGCAALGSLSSASSYCRSQDKLPPEPAIQAVDFQDLHPFQGAWAAHKAGFWVPMSPVHT